MLAQLDDKIAADRQYKEHIDSANKYIEARNYQKALATLENAKKIKDTDEVRKLISDTTEKNLIVKMKKDFESLKGYFKGRASDNRKISRCREFQNKHKNAPKNEETDFMVSETRKFISQIDYQRYIIYVKGNIEVGNYGKARDYLNQAKQINDSDEVRELYEKIDYEIKNGGKEYHAIKNKLNLNRYLVFKKIYPISSFLPDLENRLKRVDKWLPPERYWNKPIKKNGKGYYELTFGKEHNWHLMIYIPQKKVWIDKYEVSWAQFRKFLKDEKIQFPPIADFF